MGDMEFDAEEIMPEGRRAVAIQYDKETMTAPAIVATGRGHVAAQIVRIARENNVPLRSDPMLAESLAGLDLGAQIPPELYRAVAEVLAFIYKLNAMHGPTTPGKPAPRPPAAPRRLPPATIR